MRHELRHTIKPPSESAPPSDGIGTIRREPIALDPAMNVLEAFAAVTRGCIAHITAAAAAARQSDDPEGIHQLRVGIRRLRAAFSVFRPALPGRRPKAVMQLRALQQRLGAARELDVLLEETIASMPAKRRNGCGMRELIDAVGADRVLSHRRARTALVSKQCTELLSQLGPAIDRYAKQHADDPAADEIVTEPIIGFAADVLRSRHRRACKLGDKNRDLGPQQLHKLRIRIKKLRYAVEFFRDLTPGAQTESYLRALKDLQQVLGTAHDAVVASCLTAEIGKRKGPHAGRATALVQEWAKADFKRAQRKLERAWRRFAKCERPLKSAKKQQRRLRGQHRHASWISGFANAAGGT